MKAPVNFCLRTVSSELFLLFLLLFSYLIFLIQPISLTTTDLGRHLANGREILAANHQILFKNVYSYTMPEQAFVNHHWLSGLIFYLITLPGRTSQLGLVMLQLAFATLSVSTFLLFYTGIRRLSTWKIASLLSLLFVFVFGHRTEIRPEVFGYFFISVYLIIVQKIQQNHQLSLSSIVLLLAQQLLWTNLHISFFFGPMIFFLLVLEKLFYSRFKLTKDVKKLIFAFISLMVVSIINPNHFFGLLQPLSIFHNYGYDVVENKDLIFLLSYFNMTSVAIVLLAAAFCLALLVFYYKKIQPFYLALAAIGVLLGVGALRNITLFILFSGPLLALGTQNLLDDVRNKLKITWQKSQSLIFLVILAVTMSLLASSGKIKANAMLSTIQLGLATSQAEGAIYFKNNQLKGPIFNDFDLGSYLIFYLYPQEKVFVDNRPEAFSVNFFQKTYIPMQLDENLWQEQLAKYNFQTIFFRTADYTPWARQFLRKRRDDPAWRKVQENQDTIIFVRNDKPNSSPMTGAQTFN
ncbi:MAG: hypothetical protein ACOZAN_02665 [Patescibacteria group bacterium]